MLVLLVRNDRLGTVVVGAATAATTALGVYLLVKMLGGGAAELFLGGRTDDVLSILLQARDEEGKPIAPPGPKTRQYLDWLLN